MSEMFSGYPVRIARPGMEREAVLALKLMTAPEEALAIIEALLSGSLSPEALSIIEAVLAWKYCRSTCYGNVYEVRLTLDQMSNCKPDPCPTCGGSGTVDIDSKDGVTVFREQCPDCGGTGVKEGRVGGCERGERDDREV